MTPSTPNQVEIVTPTEGPTPQKPTLPLRVSSYDAQNTDRWDIEKHNGSEWVKLGSILPDTVQTFDVGMDCQALRAVAVNVQVLTVQETFTFGAQTAVN